MSEQSFLTEDAFNDAVNQAVAELEGPPAEPEVPAEEPVEATSEPAEETVEEPEEESVAAEAEPEGEKLYAGKYKTVEAMEEAVAHQEEMIRRQSAEVGETRKMRDELTAMRTQLETMRAPVQQVDERAATVTAQLVDQGRYQEAAQYAIQANPYLYRSVMEEWASQEPFAAMDFHASQREQLLADTLQRQMAPTLEAAGELGQRTELTQALDTVARAHDDFAEIVGSLSEERLGELIQGGFPTQVLQGVQGSVEEKQAVFETLYRWVKADQAGSLSDAAARAVEQKRAESRQQKAQAAVASATTSPNLEKPPKTAEEQLAEEISAEWGTFSKEASVLDGWTGRDSRGSPR